MSESFLNGKVELHCGDLLAVLPTLAENSIDACVCDPPYGLQFMGREWDKLWRNRSEADRAYIEKIGPSLGARLRSKSVDYRSNPKQMQDFHEAWAREVYRVLKPGAHLLAFGGTRTFHRMACAIEDAGFEVRDCIFYIYGSGFPKSHDVSKGIDRAAGAEREIVGLNPTYRKDQEDAPSFTLQRNPNLTSSATAAAHQWEGWGTALKPSTEPVIIAQKPLNNGDNITIIGSTLLMLWSRLWLMLSAKDAAALSTLSPSVCGVVPFDFAQWSADDVSNIRAALCGQMGTLQLESALISSLSTVFSWSSIWAASLTRENTSIIETELRTIIDLKILKLLALKITPVSIIQAHSSGAWLNANASTAEKTLNAVVLRLKSILELSALANASIEDAICCQDEIDRIVPALRPIVLARKPLSEGTVAANILKWNCGAINVDGCRVGLTDTDNIVRMNNDCATWGTYGSGPNNSEKAQSLGRWPANLIHDGSEEVLAGFPESDGQQGDLRGTEPSECFNGVYSGPKGRHVFEKRGDTGSAARFFYTAKADSDDRLGSKHPTVKPLDLMQYLVRLVTPRGGTVLDCFAGTGTTGEAAFREGFRAVLIEREAEYQIDIRRRMKLAMSGPDERARESIKERMKDKPVDHGPLFGGLGVEGITHA